MSDAAILQALKGIDARLARIERSLASGPTSRSSGSGGGMTADDRDLDSQWGDPLVKKDPKKWIEEGFESRVGMPFSHCEPEFLDMLASLKDWQAQKDEESGDPAKQKYVGYARKDAARARGWAARLRSGWKPPQFANGGTGSAHSPRTGVDAPATDRGGDGFDADDIPFITCRTNWLGL